MKTRILSLNLILVAGLLVSPLVGWGKVKDFNSMIHENAMEQKNLHKQLKEEQGWKAVKVEKKPELVVLESTAETYNPETSKSLLTYGKEKVDHRPKQKKQMERVASELSESQREF